MEEHFIRLFDRHHTLLAELYDICDDLTYSWTLDDIANLTVSIPLEHPLCTPENLQFTNHVEVVGCASNVLIWGGILMGQEFHDGCVQITCSDYTVLLKYRRLRAKIYPPLDYGTLLQQMITDTEAAQANFPLGITDYLIDRGALQTSKEVKNNELLWDKLKEFCAEMNYDCWLDEARRFHFWLRKGIDKSHYHLEWGGDYDNILAAPQLSRDIKTLANLVYTDATVQDGKNTMVYWAETRDTVSEEKYGLFEEYVTPSSTEKEQALLDILVNSTLQRTSIPADTITVTAADTALCPFSDLETGDHITLQLFPYFNYTANARILQMKHTEKTQTRQFTLGNLLLKPQAPQMHLYHT